jgi:small conductance mechanosensitive channel
VGADKIHLTLKEDGDFSLDGRHGLWEARGNQLRLASAGKATSYEYELTKDALTLRGGDLRKDVKLTRQTNVVDYVGDWFSISGAKLRQKAFRVGIILAVVAGARLVIVLLQALSEILIYSNRGLFRHVYKFNKRRVRTYHLLVLNVVKYVIYLVALGFLLTEFGVDYTTYVASLSVVGLAIGFGTQGLVQDMVTGLFVIFENQFDVGDMIEISGQTGVVTELGLRSTRLRNYLGQEMIIPNRNISVVGNYRAGAMQALVDVSVTTPEAARKGEEVLTTLLKELHEQFQGVIMTPPVVEGVFTLDTQERFVRARLHIWPGQQWVVDQQVLPRVREAFQRAEVVIPADRVVVTYNFHEKRHGPTLTERLAKRIQHSLPWGRHGHDSADAQDVSDDG